SYAMNLTLQAKQQSSLATVGQWNTPNGPTAETWVPISCTATQMKISSNINATATNIFHLVYSSGFSLNYTEIGQCSLTTSTSTCTWNGHFVVPVDSRIAVVHEQPAAPPTPNPWWVQGQVVCQ